jgi:hypothetical protein
VQYVRSIPRFIALSGGNQPRELFQVRDTADINSLGPRHLELALAARTFSTLSSQAPCIGLDIRGLGDTIESPVTQRRHGHCVRVSMKCRG